VRKALCQIEVLPTSRVTTAMPCQKSWPPCLRSEPAVGLKLGELKRRYWEKLRILPGVVLYV
jgi:hypothetical protein